jgi:hypothetical protein
MNSTPQLSLRTLALSVIIGLSINLRVPLSVLPVRIKLTLPVIYSSLLIGEFSHSVTVLVLTLPSGSISGSNRQVAHPPLINSGLLLTIMAVCACFLMIDSGVSRGDLLILANSFGVVSGEKILDFV